MANLDKDKILFWEGDGEYGFLSNFSYIPVFYDNKKWLTSEHAYQAAKFDNPVVREKILNAKSPDEAFQIGRNTDNIRRTNWDEIKVQVMEDIVSEKLKQNSYLNELLLKTGNKEIIEASSTDSFWGWGPKKDGENHMGKIWIKLREKIQNGK